ncbi:MAG TPA: hypothetical protein VGW12_04140 [Pyrinomonadaceae bacterium]|nr:hypothetical protein [Pyrinomonadaceae bacterium]
MEKTLQVLNRMQADGVLGQYAIGGAIAATFYIEPVSTSDLDIFFTAAAASGQFLSLAPLYDYLAASGYEAAGEAVEIEGWPVQFLPAFNQLLEEALAQAETIQFKSTPTRVMRAEHLVAVMLQTGRPKDYSRIIQFLEVDAVQWSRLSDVLTRHDLTAHWEEFKRKFNL